MKRAKVHNSKGLTPKQDRFCLEYIKDLSAADAARRMGASEKSCRQIGSRYLSLPQVHDRVAELKAKQAERLELKADDVLRELLIVLKMDIAEVYEPDGKMKLVHNIKPEIRRAIAGIDVEELFEGHGRDRVQVGFTKKLKLWDKMKAAELLGKHLKLFADTLNLNVEVGFADKLRKARERAAARGKKA